MYVAYVFENFFIVFEDQQICFIKQAQIRKKHTELFKLFISLRKEV